MSQKQRNNDRQLIAVAMGVAVIVLSTLKALDVTAGVSMLGLGLAAQALANFQA